MNSWPNVSLGEVFDIARGGSPRPIQKFLTQDPNGINWVMIGDALENSKYISSTKNRIIEEGVKKSRMVQPGDFLLTNSMSFGKPYIMNTSGCIHDGWLVLSPSGYDVDPDFFYYLLGSDFMYTEFTRRAAGATVKNLNINLVKGVTVTLPPLEEQKRIAGILDAADILRAKRREALARLDDLLQSTFLDLFGDPENKSLISTMLEDGLLKLHKDGNHGSQYPRSNEFEESGIPFLSAKCISEDGNLIHDEVQFLNEQKARTLKIGWIEKGDVLLAHNASVGKTILYNGEFDEALIGTSLTAFRPDNEFIESAYLLGALRSNNFQRQLFANMGQTTRNQVPITAQRRLSFPIPPLDLQRSFAEIVTSVEEQKAKMRKHLEQLDDLFASLQQRAFRGDL